MINCICKEFFLLKKSDKAFIQLIKLTLYVVLKIDIVQSSKYGLKEFEYSYSIAFQTHSQKLKF